MAVVCCLIIKKKQKTSDQSYFRNLLLIHCNNNILYNILCDLTVMTLEGHESTGGPLSKANPNTEFTACQLVQAVRLG